MPLSDLLDAIAWNSCSIDVLAPKHTRTLAENVQLERARARLPQLRAELRRRWLAGDYPPR